MAAQRKPDRREAAIFGWAIFGWAIFGSHRIYSVALATQPVSARSTLSAHVIAGEQRQLRHSAKPARLIEYWHLLSLDAPTIAALWAWSFARAFGLALPAASLLLLFVGTWLFYAADRILDGTHQESARLRERHLFYLQHRAVAVMATIPAGTLIAWLAFFRMLPRVRLDDALIFTVAAAYFLLVHAGGRIIERWFPKELIVAVVFAAATTAPAWGRLHTAAHHSIFVFVTALFAALCWLNCIAIEKWERPTRVSLTCHRGEGAVDSAANRTTRWGQRHLHRLSILLAAASVFAAAFLLHADLSNSSTARLCFAVALAAAIFPLLDRRPLSAFHLRIAADAALLTPALVFLIR